MKAKEILLLLGVLSCVSSAAAHRNPKGSLGLSRIVTDIGVHPRGYVQVQSTGEVPFPASAALDNVSEFPAVASVRHHDKPDITDEKDDIDSPKDGEPLSQTLMALGGGTGAILGSTGHRGLDKDLVRRMRYQDHAMVVLVVMAYLVGLLFVASLTYRQAGNNSSVTYYADPRTHNTTSDGNDIESFLDAFSQCPSNCRLQVTGYEPGFHRGRVRWRGELYQIAFTFSLDLSPWIVRESNMNNSDVDCLGDPRPTLEDGVVSEDLEKLRDFLANDANDLAVVELHKQVMWDGWEELATNIKHQIRQRGFNGIVGVTRCEDEPMRVYKNRTWANFMHSRGTKMLCALSVAGWLVYLPYMWFRCSRTCARLYYRVDTPITTYWHLIADKLNATGFEDSRRT